MYKLIERVIKWNRDRGLLEKFDPALEIKMLSEEAKECQLAEEPAHALQEYCDFLFVGIGTEAKFRAQAYPSTMTFLLAQENHEVLFKWQEDTGEYLLARVEAMLPQQVPFGKAVKAALEIITEANEAKGKKKNKDGKVVKNTNHVDPLIKIREYLEDYRYGN